MWGFLLDESYRDIGSVRVTIRHFGDLGSRPDTRKFTRQNLPQVIACLNPRCSNGGCDLTQAIRKLIEERPTELRMAIACLGHDGTPRGRGRDNPCGNSIEIHLEPVYAEPRVHPAAHISTAQQQASGDHRRLSSTEPTGGRGLGEVLRQHDV